jgi:hypothetical protein
MNVLHPVVPPIKCQGIKTKLVPWIGAVKPSTLNGTWIEPFMGSRVWSPSASGLNGRCWPTPTHT